MNKVFISYVRENIEIVDRLCQELKSHGIEVWLDRDNIALGLRWKREIRRAIQQGAFFIACFSKEYDERDKTYMNEELTIAIEELRQRPIDQAWFLPVKLNECEIPDLDIGRGETLRDLQYVNLYENWEVNVQRILEIVQPASSETINANTVEQSVDLNAVAEFFKGLTYQNRRNYEKAVEHYTEALRLYPQLVEAYNNRGNIYNSRGEYDRAIAGFTKAIQLRPNYAEAYNNRGISYQETDEHGLAIVDFTKAIQLRPNYAEAYNNRGVSCQETDEYDHAIADLAKAIQLKPDNANAYNNRGGVYIKKGDYDRALRDLNTAIDLKPDYITYANRGIAYDKKGDFNRAIEDYTKVIVLKPDYAEAYTQRGIAYDKKGDYDPSPSKTLLRR